MLVTSVQAWYSNFSILFEKIITSDDNICFHPLSYNDLALVICKKLKEYTYIGLQDVFNISKCTDDKCVLNDKKIMQLCEENDGVIDLCGCAKITFFSYDYFPTYPFSKFAVTYNGQLYDIDGTGFFFQLLAKTDDFLLVIVGVESATSELFVEFLLTYPSFIISK